MERHRELLLQQAMDLVWLTGSVAVRWDEFYLWTGVQRIAKKPWRVVHQVWEELCLEQGYDKALPLTVLSLDHTVVFRREPFPTENVNALEDLT